MGILSIPVSGNRAGWNRGAGLDAGRACWAADPVTTERVYYDFPMPLFLVVAPEPAAMSSYEDVIKTAFAENFIKISPTVWAVSSSGIAKDVAVKITGEPIPTGAATLVVVAVSGYWGVAQNSIWEWFASKMSTTNAPTK